MSEKIEGFSIGLDIDSVQVESGLQDLNKKLQLVNSEMKANLSAFDYGDKSMQKYQTQLTGLNKKLDVQKVRVESARKTYEKMVAEHGEGSKQAEKAAIAYNKESASLNSLERYIGKVTDEMNASQSASKKYGEQLTKISEKADKVGNILTTTLTPAMLAVGAAAVIGAGNFEESQVRIQNSLGLTEDEANKLADVANNVFKEGWGESLDSVTNSLLEVKEQLSNIPAEELEGVTKQAIALEEQLGMDVTESLRGVNALMKGYGLTAQEAFDYLVTGAQNGLDKTDELGDNLAEYVPLWEQNGYSIQEMFSTLEAGLDAGAYNLDKVNDLVKEFGIRVGDGTVKAAIEEMGGSWQEIYDGWEKAGGTNAELFDLMAANLASIEDPQAKQLALTEIWGSIGEDAGLKVVEALGNVEDKYGDVNGASEKIVENTEESFGQRSQAILRKYADRLVPLGEILLEIGEDALPILESVVEDLTDAWEGMDEEQQQSVVSMGMTAAAAGPLVKLFSGITGGVGSLLTKLPSLNKDTLKTADALGSVTKVGGAATTSASVLTKGVGLLTGALNPATLAVGGLLLALGAGTVVWKTWGEEALASSERTQKWGSDIGEAADEALTDFQNLSSEASLATELMAVNLENGAERAVNAFSGMAEGIKEDINSTITETQEGLAGLPASVREIVAESLNEGIAEQSELIAEVDTIQASITEIYETALAENREISDKELAIIENYHTRLSEIRSETLQLSADEQREVQAIMAEDLESFSIEQLAKRQELLAEERDRIKEGYDEQAAILEENLTSGVLSKQKYNDAMAALNAEEVDDMLVVASEYKKIWDERGDIPEATQRKILEDMGLTLEQVEQYLAREQIALENSAQNMITTSENASEEVKKANDMWNSSEWLDKEGNISTNAFEMIREASQSEEGWENLQFMAHNAELDTNSMQIIQEALMANGMWWEMDFPSQFADLETNAGTTASMFLESVDKWEGLEFETHTAILNSNSTEELEKVLRDTGVWENLSPSEQQMIVTTNAGAAAKEGLIAQGLWNALSPEEQNMIVQTNSTQKAIEGAMAAYEWNGLSWIRKSAVVETNAPGEVNKGVRARDTWNGLHYSNKYANLDTNASNTETKLRDANNYFRGIRSDSRTFTLNYVTEGTPFSRAAGAGAFYAKGTNYHPGGLAVLGDGGKAEPFMTPKGHIGISPDTDTILDLPRGTKVWPSIDAWRSKLPHFATGSANTATDAMKLLAIAGRNASADSRSTYSESTNVNTGTTSVAGDTYNINVSVNGNIPQSEVDRLAKKVTQSIKREENKRKNAKGRTVNSYG